MCTCLKEDLHCLGAGVLGRLVYGIITIVAGSTGACIELSYLQDTIYTTRHSGIYYYKMYTHTQGLHYFTHTHTHTRGLGQQLSFERSILLCACKNSKTDTNLFMINCTTDCV